MLSDFRMSRTGVVCRAIGISALVAILFVSGCTSGKSEPTVGPPAKLAFSVQPVSVAAGASITPAVTVSIEDSQGNVVTTATNQVTIAIGTNPSNGTLGGTATVTAVAGVATFSNLSINNVGTGYTLSASATGLTAATSNAFNVTGPPTKLAFTVQPSAVVGGSSITPAVAVSIEDAQGNVVTTATSQITIAIGTNPGSGTLGGTLQANAVAGVATFSNLSINKLGTGYTLTAGATGLTGATSNAFNVTAGAPAKLAFTVQPSNVTAGSSISPSVAVAVEDAAGNLVTTATNSITIAISNNPSGGTLGGTVTVAAVSGVATFPGLNINLAGTGYTLSAGATGLTSATSSAFNVTAGAAAKLAFTVQPTNVTAGSAISPSVAISVEDSLGNLVTSAANSVTVAISNNPSSGTLGGTLTVAAVSGVATFPGLSINKSGTGYTLGATATSLTSATSNGFNVTAGAANKLVYTVQPSGVAAGSSISPAVVVSVEDSLGNVVTSASNSITIAPSSGTLNGTTVIAASSGVATFSNLSINTIGSYTLTATATGLASATSATFNVTAGTASKLAFTVQPSNVTAGSSISPAVTVSVEDSLGNVVTSASNSITITPSSGTLNGTTVIVASSGVATFSNLSVNTTGSYTLTASATGLTSATSGSFIVSAGGANKLAFTVQPSNVSAGSSFSPAVAVSVEDVYGNLVTLANNQITIAPSTGTLNGTAAVTASSGVATFPGLSINTPGSYSLTASATGLASVTSASFNIAVGAAAKLVFTAQPSNVTAGAAITPAVAVSVEDSVGNVVTTATNQITISPSSGTLNGTTAVAGASGVATFSNLSINATGSYTLTATATGLTSGNSSAFNVTAGTASKLAFTVQPSNVLPGSAISPAVAVSVEDSFGNVVPSAINSITVAIGNNPGSGTLAGTLTVAAVNGVATFPNLSINAQGIGYTLTAATSGFTTITSASFSNVATGVPAKLAFTVQPSNVTAGSSISPSVAVTVEDLLGTPVASATNSITIAISNNPSSGTLGGTLTVAAVNGVATFPGLNINLVGTGYTLGATATGLTSATSGSFNVTAGAANKLAFTVQPTSVTAGSSITPAVAVSVEDAQGNLVTTATNSITVSIVANPSSGTLAGTVTVAAASGVATFPGLNINKSGTGYTLGATATSLTSAVTTPFNVTAGAANKLAFTVQPSGVTAGSSISPAVVVSVEDSLGNVVTSASNSITISPSSGTLLGTTAVTASSGVATFSNLSISTTGSYSLTATATGLTSATSGSFIVTAGVANKLVFTVQPSNVTAASSIAPAVVVSVEDSLGNVVTSASNQITMSPSSGSLNGSTVVTASSGVATFSNLSINTAGSYALTATATGLTSATSASFNVAVGTANKLVFSVQPSNVTAGVAIAPAITVSIEDAGGNLLTTATNSITIAISNNPSSGTLSGTPTAAAVNGVATFSNLSINHAGTGYTLGANATGLTTATSGSFNVSAGSAAILAFTVQPSNVTIATAFSPVVTVSVEDSLGNVVPSATNSITVAIGNNPSSGTLGGTLTVAAVNGMATFPDLTINNAGNGYTLTAAATSFTTVTSSPFNVAASCTNNCALTGNVTVNGQALGYLTITLTGPSPATTVTTAITASNGTYSFSGLTAGTYTITAPAGYTYVPGVPLVLPVNSTNTVQNFTATSTTASDTITGTVSYAGTKTGLLYIRVYNSGGCTGNCNNSPVAGTSFALTGSSGSYSGSYTVRGLQSGQSYYVAAEIDALNSGAPNASNPWGQSSTFAVSAGYGVPNILLTDPTPPTPASPCKLSAAPASAFVLLQYNQGGGGGGNCSNSNLLDSNGRELATSYRVYYDTSSGFTSNTYKTFVAHGAHDNVYILQLPGLASGTPYYFKVSAVVGTTVADSNTATATYVAPSGGSTVTGTVTYQLPTGVPAATGPLYVGVFNGTSIYGIMVPKASLTSPYTYTILNVPAGNYQEFAIIDMNNNGVIEPSDITNVNNKQGGGGPPALTVPAAPPATNISLTTNVSATSVTTFSQQFLTNTETYNLTFGIAWGTQRPVAMTLISGPNVPVPWDMPVDSNNSEQDPNFPSGNVPLVGDLYTFQVTLYNPLTLTTSTQTMTATVSAVLGFAQNLAMDTPVNSTNSTYPAAIPMLNWTAPSTLPTITPYTYSVGLYDPNNGSGVNWNYYGSGNGNGLPSTQLDVMFDTDGSASGTSSCGSSPSSPCLASGTTYNWYVNVQDNNGNQSQYTTTYTTPAGSGGNTLPSITQSPTSQSVLAGNTVTFTAAATGTPTPTVQWQVSTNSGSTFSNISGATSATYSFTAQLSQNAYMYQAVFTNSVGNVSTSPAVLTVSSPNLAITSNPNSVTLLAGATATFTAAASGSPTPTVQWQVSNNGGNTFTTISGQTSSTLTLTNTTESQNNTEYQAIYTNTSGSLATATAYLTVGDNASCSDAPSGHNGVLTGRWVVRMQGWSGSNPAYPAASVFSFDANGSGGFVDVSGTSSGITGNLDANFGVNGSSSVVSTTISTSSTYQVGLDPTNNSGYLGCMTLVPTTGNPVVLRFALSVPSTTAVKGRIIRWTDTSTNGAETRASGEMLPQDAAAFSLSSLHTNYAYGEDGSDNNGRHLAIAGIFSLNTSTGAATSTYDTDDGGNVSANQSETATITGLSSTTGRGLDSGTPQGSSTVFHTAVYVVNANEIFLVGIDPFTNGSIYSGRAIVTGTSFTNSSLSGNYVLVGTGMSSGNSSCNGGGTCGIAALGVLQFVPGTPSGTLSSNSTLYQYNAGSALQTNNPNGTYSISTSGRAPISTSNPSDHPPVLYLATPQTNTEPISAFIVGTDSSALFGTLSVGASSNVASTFLPGNYIMGTIDPGDSSVGDQAAVGNISSGGGVTGCIFESNTSGLFEGNMAGNPCGSTGGQVGTINITNSPLPGFGTLGKNDYAITDGTRVWLIDTGTNNNNTKPAKISIVEQ